MTTPLQLASLYDGQEVFVWSDCLLDRGTERAKSVLLRRISLKIRKKKKKRKKKKIKEEEGGGGGRRGEGGGGKAPLY